MAWTLGYAFIVILLCHLATAATVPALEWNNRFGGSQDEWIGALTSDPAGNIYIAGTTTSVDMPANGALRLTGGTNLRRVGPSGAIELLRPPLAGIVRAMAVARDSLYVATTAGVMFTRSNNGTAWEILPTGAVPKRFITDMAVEPNNPAVVYLVANGLWKTSDGGKNWAPLAGTGEAYGQPATIYSVTIDPRRPGTVYAIGSAGVFRSSDTGASWAQLPDRASSIAFDVERSGVVYAAGYSAGSGSLRISENFGVDWKPLPWPGSFQPDRRDCGSVAPRDNLRPVRRHVLPKLRPGTKLDPAAADPHVQSHGQRRGASPLCPRGRHAEAKPRWRRYLGSGGPRSLSLRGGQTDRVSRSRFPGCFHAAERLRGQVRGRRRTGLVNLFARHHGVGSYNRTRSIRVLRGILHEAHAVGTFAVCQRLFQLCGNTIARWATARVRSRVFHRCFHLVDRRGRGRQHPHHRRGPRTLAAKAGLTVESGGQRSLALGVGFAAAAPALFTADGSGTGQALALNADGTLNSAANPASRGSVLGLAVLN